MPGLSFDVAALGELLTGFTENGVSEQGGTLFEANPSGAPCNVPAMLGKLGRKAAYAVDQVQLRLFFYAERQGLWLWSLYTCSPS